MNKFFPFFITILLLFSCNSKMEEGLILVQSNNKLGFNFPYLLFLPDTLPSHKDLILIVEPNNSGFADDDLKKHLEKAQRTASKDFYIGNFIARRLQYPLLVPVFPRSKSDWKTYTHALDRDVILQKNNPLERIDIQLIKMIDHARDTLLTLGYRTKQRVLLTGFSASGTFANRFSLIHPDRIFAVAAGGLNGLLMLPINEINSQDLNYPLGIKDFKDLFKEDFDSIAFKNIPQFLFMGKLDENDAIMYDDGYDQSERGIVLNNIGESIHPTRWNTCNDIYSMKDINAIVVTYDSIGHEHPLFIKEEIVSFFESVLKNEINKK